MYFGEKKGKLYFPWILGTSIGLFAGLAAAILAIPVIYNVPFLDTNKGLINFLPSAIAGLFLGFGQGIALTKLLKKQGLSTNIRQLTIKWILATTIGFAIGGQVTSIWTNVDGNLTPQMLVFHLSLILFLIGLAQAIIMQWSIKKISQWLLAHILSILASVLVGVVLFFLIISIGGALSGGGLGVLIYLLFAPIPISASTGLIYGYITILFLPNLLKNDI
ncbi:hypothetical protein NOS3756_04950 [Nostoc sp. NIES-3756]|uniref:hypothetical protein n=1 Tax=Nostoc sp. NIES-3756 TaxID=1751286 RepID=UPI000720A8A7|nr:hypothetical protein [Nostoc sp. NIES-3756]BAT51569.1 hypothetical protein NOS3756_04950 [Nostoc sp. NIES-3756]